MGSVLVQIRSLCALRAHFTYFASLAPSIPSASLATFQMVVPMIAPALTSKQQSKIVYKALHGLSKLGKEKRKRNTRCGTPICPAFLFFYLTRVVGSVVTVWRAQYLINMCCELCVAKLWQLAGALCIKHCSIGHHTHTLKHVLSFWYLKFSSLCAFIRLLTSTIRPKSDPWLLLALCTFLALKSG